MGSAATVQLGIETAEALQQALAELLPDAMNVQIATVNASHDRFEVLGLRALLSEIPYPGSSRTRQMAVRLPILSRRGPQIGKYCEHARYPARSRNAIAPQ